MSFLARSLVVGLAVVAAVLAAILARRRLQAALPSAPRGRPGTLRHAFWVAAVALVGTAGAGCPVATCYEPAPPDVDAAGDVDGADEDRAEEDAADDATGDGATADDEATGDATTDGDAGAEAASDVVPESPDVPATPDGEGTCYFAAFLEDSSRNADDFRAADDDGRAPSRPDVRRARRIVRRSRALAQLLAEPSTESVVREELERQAPGLRGQAEAARLILRRARRS